MRKITYVLVLAVMAVSGCETTKGLGRDVSTAGTVLEREAYEAQRGY